MSLSRSPARRLVALLPGGLLRWVVRTFRSGSSVTVVVRVSDDNAVLLGECVDALGGQTRRADEIVLVVTGTGSDTVRAVARAERSSWRIRTVRAPSASATAAWDRGCALARGDYVWCVDAGDGLRAEALDRLAGALDRSGSDLALTGGRDASGLTLATAPEAVRDLSREQQLVRRSRCRPGRPGGSETAGELVAGWLAAVEPLLAAERFDTVAVEVTAGPRRGTGEAFSTMPVLAPHVPGWVQAVHAVEARLAQDAPAAVAELRAWLLVDELPRWLGDAERCTPEEWAALAAEARRLHEHATPADLAAMMVEDRVRLWLATQGRQADLARFNAERWLDEGQYPTRVVDGRLRAVLPAEQVPDDLPAELLELGERETGLGTRLLAWRRDGDRLEVTVAAWVRGVDSEPGEIRAELALLDGGERRLTTGPVEVSSDPEVARMSGARFQDHRLGRVTGRFDGAGGRGRLEVGLHVRGVHRTAVLDVPERAAGPWSVDEVELHPTSLLVRGSGPAGGRVAVVLAGPLRQVSAEAVAGPAGFEARVDLEVDRWGLGPAPVPVGGYRLRLLVDGVPLDPAPGAALDLPLDLRSPTFRGRLTRPGAALELALTAPLADEEVGAFAQQRLQRWYADDAHRVDPGAVYLQSYTGQTATDSPLALHHELRRVRPDLRLRWGVADRATRVPEGGEPVLMHSREWYAALATSGSVVTNIDLERWFVKRPGQRVLQTFHGYPAKTMGISAWLGKNFTPLRIERQLRRTSATWDLLLTPTPAMDVHYREQYRYDGPIHPYGYPRDDVLVGPDADAVRAATRARLGIGDRLAVLYAPTWRDDLATNFRAAPLVNALDVERLTDALGDDVVVLLRGHRFHRQRSGLSSRVLDVTDHPEINDLVLAADVAVLDYSSLRFDFALTGRPMLFLVPDLDRYEGGVRGFLHPFRGSAPGPLVATTEEVVAALRDLDAVAAAHREDYERFNREFNAHQDGHAAERVVEAFFGVARGAGPASGAV